MKRILGVALLLTACASSPAAGVPDLELSGSGELAALPVPNGWGINELHVAPNERWIVASCATGSANAIVLDAELKLVANHPNRRWRKFGIRPDSRTAFVVQERTVEFWDLPALYQSDELAAPEGYRAPAVHAICPIPGQSAWALVARDQAGRVETDPPAVGAKGKTAINQPVACAADAETGYLVIIGDTRELEVLDAKTMRYVGRLSLPCTAASPQIAAFDGHAYVGTRDGFILPVDLKTLQVGKKVQVAKAGEVQLALSAAGRVLAAAQVKQDGSIALRVYRVGDSGIRKIASANVKGDASVNDLEVLEARKTVLVAGRASFAWRYAK